MYVLVVLVNFGTDVCSKGYLTIIRYICNIPVV